MAGCNICNKKVLPHSYRLSCSICNNLVHLKCLPFIDQNDDVYIKRTNNDWICTVCTKYIFPFNHLEDDESFYDIIQEQAISEPCIPVSILCNDSQIFNPFDLNEEATLPLSDIDPDLQFYSNHCQQNFLSCDYFLEDDLNKKTQNLGIKNENFSLIHANIRSATKNLSKLDTYLSNISHEFSIIALSETWGKDHNVDRYGIDNYKAEHKYRSCRNGGGVALFIKDHIEYHVRNDLSIQNAFIESLFVEIAKETVGKNKNVICGVVYRPPDTDVKKFNEYISAILSSIKQESKLSYLVGDFNINLLSIDSHNDTHEFSDILFSHSFIPYITKPTRITSKSATLIDNIFSTGFTECDNNVLNGILYTDITDHFPVFHIDYSNNTPSQPEFVTKRAYTQENLD